MTLPHCFAVKTVWESTARISSDRDQLIRLRRVWLTLPEAASEAGACQTLTYVKFLSSQSKHLLTFSHGVLVWAPRSQLFASFLVPNVSYLLSLNPVKANKVNVFVTDTTRAEGSACAGSHPNVWNLNLFTHLSHAWHKCHGSICVRIM